MWFLSKNLQANKITCYSFPPPLFFILIFFPEIMVPFPSLDILPNNINEKMILLPLFLFSTLYSSP